MSRPAPVVPCLSVVSSRARVCVCDEVIAVSLGHDPAFRGSPCNVVGDSCAYALNNTYIHTHTQAVPNSPKLFLTATRPVYRTYGVFSTPYAFALPLLCESVCACSLTQSCFARAKSQGPWPSASRSCVSDRLRLGKVDAPTLEFRQLHSHFNHSFVNCDSHLRHSRCARNGNVSTVTSTVCSRQAHRRRPFYRTTLHARSHLKLPRCSSPDLSGAAPPLCTSPHLAVSAAD